MATVFQTNLAGRYMIGPETKLYLEPAGKHITTWCRYCYATFINYKWLF